MNVADYVVSVLEDYGIKQVFAYPGTPILPFLNAIDRNPNIERILMRHEAAESLAASAQAKLTKTLAVCASTSGPGATNMVTGVADAHLDRAPLLAITGILPTWKQGRTEFQDINQTQLYSTITGLSVECKTACQLPYLLRQCISYAEKFHEAVHLAIPSDVFETTIEPHNKLYQLHDMPKKANLMPATKAAYQIAADELNETNNVCILVGPRAFDAGTEIELLSKKMNAPIICSFAGKGIINEEHENYFGVYGIYGTAGSSLGQNVISLAETILAFGVTDLASFLTDNYGTQSKCLVQCEQDFSTANYQFHHSRSLFGPLEITARELRKRVKRNTCSKLLNELSLLKNNFKEEKLRPSHHQFIHPGDFFTHLNKFIDESAILCMDVGDNGLWAQHFITLTKHQRVLVSNKLGSMGFGIAASISSKLICPDSTVIVICGDGAAQMYLGEFITAQQNNLDIIFVIIENGTLGRVCKEEETEYWTHIKDPDFTMIANACGFSGIRVDKSTDIDNALNTAFNYKNGPFLLEVKTDPVLLPTEHLTGLV